MRQSTYVRETLEHICAWVGTGRREPRPNRLYLRRSLPPAPKWSRRKTKKADEAPAPSAELPTPLCLAQGDTVGGAIAGDLVGRNFAERFQRGRQPQLY